MALATDSPGSVVSPRSQTLRERRRMVDKLARRGIRDPRVLAAMREVPREAFVAATLSAVAHDDCALPIDAGQTISQPYIAALMIEAAMLLAGDKVLEVGAGSGYAAAVLGHIAHEVYAIERHEELTRQAEQRLSDLGLRDNIRLRTGDGTRGWPEAGPFDAIIVSAGAPEVPPDLKAQLAPGGRLVLPVGPSLHFQRLMKITRTGKDRYTSQDLGGVAFVALIGEQGWPQKR